MRNVTLKVVTAATNRLGWYRLRYDLGSRCAMQHRLYLHPAYPLTRSTLCTTLDDIALRVSIVGNAGVYGALHVALNRSTWARYLALHAAGPHTLDALFLTPDAGIAAP